MDVVDKKLFTDEEGKQDPGIKLRPPVSEKQSCLLFHKTPVMDLFSALPEGFSNLTAISSCNADY